MHPADLDIVHISDSRPRRCGSIFLTASFSYAILPAALIHT